MPPACVAATKIILPGVGHFGQMMRALDALGVRETLVERIRAGVPFLGICLGLQALFESSEEAPEVRGLGIYPGTVRRFPPDARVPHMGWNDSKPRPASQLCATSTPAPTSTSPTATTCPRTRAPPPPAPTALPYTAVLEGGNVFGVQFHPEKSGPRRACDIVRNFAGAAEC